MLDDEKDGKVEENGSSISEAGTQIGKEKATRSENSDYPNPSL